VRSLLFRRLNRWWRGFVIALAVYAIAGVALLAFVPDLAGVFLLGAYCIPANSVIPFPHEPAVLYFARYYDPLWIATAATAGSIIASFADYAVVGAAMRHRALASTRDSQLFQWASRWRRRAPFAIVVLFSFLPLPISIVRVLAPAIDFPIGRYVLAQLVGRFPRFFVLAWIGHAFAIPTWVLIAMVILLLGLLLLRARSSGEDEILPVADALVDELADDPAIAREPV
jgi:membrane protein YqaA with SNARE-associated domain